MWNRIKTFMLIVLIYLMGVLIFTDTDGKTNSEIVEREIDRVAETISEGFSGAINIVEDDVIPFMDKQMEKLEGEKRSFSGVIVDKVFTEKTQKPVRD
tara:strand:- start:241 stop:534 length:294 start_codon:yes stop_codon:yes gene_type:complete